MCNVCKYVLTQIIQLKFNAISLDRVDLCVSNGETIIELSAGNLACQEPIKVVIAR